MTGKPKQLFGQALQEKLWQLWLAGYTAWDASRLAGTDYQMTLNLFGIWTIGAAHIVFNNLLQYMPGGSHHE